MSLIALLLGTSRATYGAEEPLLLLHYRAPTTCPSGEDFTREVRDVLGEPERVEHGTKTEVVIESNDDGSYQLSLDLPNGERRLSGANCQDLVRAAALFVALLLENPLEPADEPPPSPAPPQAPEPEKAREKHQNSARLFLGSRAGIDTGTLEMLTPTVGLVAGAVWPSIALELGAQAGLAREREIDERRTLRASYLSADLRICHRAVSSSSLSFGICGGGSAGFVRAEGLGLAEPSRKDVGFFDAHLGASLWVHPVSPLALSLDLDGVQPLLSPVVYFDGPGPEVLALESRPGARARLGARWIF